MEISEPTFNVTKTLALLLDELARGQYPSISRAHVEAVERIIKESLEESDGEELDCQLEALLFVGID